MSWFVCWAVIDVELKMVMAIWYACVFVWLDFNFISHMKRKEHMWSTERWPETSRYLRNYIQHRLKWSCVCVCVQCAVLCILQSSRLCQMYTNLYDLRFQFLHLKSVWYAKIEMSVTMHKIVSKLDALFRSRFKHNSWCGQAHYK